MLILALSLQDAARSRQILPEDLVITLKEYGVQLDGQQSSVLDSLVNQKGRSWTWKSMIDWLSGIMSIPRRQTVENLIKRLDRERTGLVPVKQLIERYKPEKHLGALHNLSQHQLLAKEYALMLKSFCSLEVDSGHAEDKSSIWLPFIRSSVTVFRKSVMF